MGILVYIQGRGSPKVRTGDCGSGFTYSILLSLERVTWKCALRLLARTRTEPSLVWTKCKIRQYGE